MKKHAYTMIAAAILLGIASVSANAQARGVRLVADIPFEFNVGDTTLPPGAYTIDCVNPNSDLKALQVTNRNGQSSILFQTRPITGKAMPVAKLVFHVYENRYFLAQLWMPEDSVGFKAPQSRAEQKVALLAHKKHEIRTVTLAANR